MDFQQKTLWSLFQNSTENPVPITPERRLYAAVLVTGIAELKKVGSYVAYELGQKDEFAEKARDWIYSNTHYEESLSFLDCCEALHLSPAAVRKRIEETSPDYWQAIRLSMEGRTGKQLVSRGSYKGGRCSREDKFSFARRGGNPRKLRKKRNPGGSEALSSSLGGEASIPPHSEVRPLPPTLIPEASEREVLEAERMGEEAGVD